MNRFGATTAASDRPQRRLALDLILIATAALVALAGFFHAPITGWLAGT